MLVHVVGGAHNDALMTLGMTAGVALVLAGSEAAGGASLLGAAAIKASALVVAPFALLGAERRARLAAGFAVAAAVVIGAGLVVFGTAVDEALRVVGDNQDRPSYASLPATLSRELGLDLDLVRGLCLARVRARRCGAASLVLAGRRLGSLRRLGGPRPAPGEQLPDALVRDLGAAAGGHRAAIAPSRRVPSR